MWKKPHTWPSLASMDLIQPPLKSAGVLPFTLATAGSDTVCTFMQKLEHKYCQEKDPSTTNHPAGRNPALFGRWIKEPNRSFPLLISIVRVTSKMSSKQKWKGKPYLHNRKCSIPLLIEGENVNAVIVYPTTLEYHHASTVCKYFDFN